MKRLRVAVVGKVCGGVGSLLRALERRFPMELVAGDQNKNQAEHADAEIHVSRLGTTVPTSSPRCARLHIVECKVTDSQMRERMSEIRFANHPSVDDRLRAQCMPTIPFGKPGAIPVTSRDDVLATLDGTPVWVIDQLGQRRCMSCSVPVAGDDSFGNIDEMIKRGLWFAIVPLVHFFREISEGSAYTAPPPRGCFVIDDPNLRMGSYGSVCYEDLHDIACSDGFHVSIACVPMDLRSSSRSVARLFRKAATHLSLCLHGNNHSRAELGRSRGERQGLRLMAQALRRSRDFSARFNVPVCPVVVPPQGRISRLMSLATHRAGIEALCGDLWASGHLLDPADGTAGIAVCDYTYDGVPVIRRYHLSYPGTMLHLFLDHPVIQYIHHYDMTDGGHALRARAQFVNSLAPVQWISLSAIVHSNYSLKSDGRTVVVLPHSARCVVPADQVGRRIAVELPLPRSGFLCAVWINDTLMELVTDGQVLRTDTYELADAYSRYEIRLQYAGSVDPDTVETPFPNPYYLLRRRMSELRDRAPVSIRRVLERLG
jgi:hypothetical protein